ncbi:MAG TPA: amidohydrolase family protein [Acidimicrobiales bacterium]|jgi:N-acyl-D-aspartate/D-glutamate deacylase|nr:amidohydrolase family protein [Acidimicrobiales bacterium]
MAHDLVIRDGTVVDGSGLGSYRADVGITGGVITSVGRIRERGRREIDAEGLVVCPGFIDGHTHLDAQLFWDPLAGSSCWHGVSTVVMGNCGFTLAPASADERALVVRNLERAEDIDGRAMAAGIDWSWETFPQYLDAVDCLPKSVNCAANVGHSALRTWAMGERAFDEPGNADDLARMRGQLEAALRAGAIGLSTSRNENHETSDDRPVASRLASWDEVRSLVGLMGDLGVGIFEIAAEGPGAAGDLTREQINDRQRELAVETRVPFTFGMLATDPGGYETLRLIDSTAARGGRMIGQTHCRGISVLLSFKTKMPFDVLPEWREIRALPLEQQRVQLRDPAVRERLVRAGMHGDYGGWRGVGAEPRKPDFDGIKVYERGLPPNPSINELAAASGVSPVDVMIDLALASDFEQIFIQPSRFPQDPDALMAALKHPRTVMTFSDSGAHLSQIADSSIHSYLFGHFVRDQKLLTIEEAVRMVTLAPALAWGFAERGLIREGMAADINVFDLARVAPAVPAFADDLPGGGRRLVQRSVGFRANIVNGEIILDDGEPTGARPGRLLRNRLARQQVAAQ